MKISDFVFLDNLIISVHDHYYYHIIANMYGSDSKGNFHTKILISIYIDKEDLGYECLDFGKLSLKLIESFNRKVNQKD